MELSNLQQVYSKLGDDLSREIYMYRIMTSISERGEQWNTKLARTNETLMQFICLLKKYSGQIVVMGSGYRGKQLVHLNQDIQWKCFIDNNPKDDTCEGIPVLKTTDFLKDYSGEIIVIASRVYEVEMHGQLREHGINEDNIINYGKILEKLMHDQYFDLPELPISDEEIFVDLGCFDAMTDVELKKRIGNKLKSVIAFEPDAIKINECKVNLEAAHIDYKLIEKGGWSKETTLRFMNVNGFLTIDDIGEEVKVTSVDYALDGEKATFIKMDIEGAEYEALKGCRNTIQKYKPKLAICIYHKLTDIFEIPALILEYCPEYKFYLRHYSPFHVETVLYGIPEV
ncbi:FkbM family methyltransferase [Lacrimispora sp.]|uniref:FkbM family methyltransferase n=1 Tax=Lacrimispora sp. TaxID=2719234 RepID=UPI0028632452|nr:FkbM family methyltransferase [Lacrimispora sp.]MDR7813502.1 FkbM family methyltransferase [Lacrimispora sp.]